MFLMTVGLVAEEPSRPPLGCWFKKRGKCSHPSRRESQLEDDEGRGRKVTSSGLNVGKVSSPEVSDGAIPGAVGPRSLHLLGDMNLGLI